MIANLILFAISASILFYVVKYRIHVYVSYEPPIAPTKASRTRLAPITDTDTNRVLTDTLIRLGAKPREAREAVARAIENSPSQDFDAILRTALQECQNPNGITSKR